MKASQERFKYAASGLFLATEIPLKIKKNAFYFTLKALFVPKQFKFLSWRFGHVEKRLNQKDKVIFKIYHVTNWETEVQYIYCPISQEVNTTRQWNMVN